ncbi:scavenger receptor class B member 1 [Zophobas morio]|uniref:scavenger receptor class B member 1 n=1 Tax=Zophobas morio TaxID=2755281 RepID=UPI0030837C14
MGLYKQYFQIGQYARNHLLGKKKKGKSGPPLLILKNGKFTNSRLAVLLIGVFTLAMGIILSSIPWVDYLILKNLRLWNGSLSFQYWQKPGVLRLTKVYIFNVTNPDSFLNLGEKPRLQEIGPFVYREDMEKVNIKFHDNGTVTYQHKKILQFVPELSVNKDQKITVPNIPLLTLSTQSNSMSYLVQRTISFLLNLKDYKPFVTVTADELVFGYDDTLVSLAHSFYPKRKRPMSRMGLLINRNGTLNEVHNIYTGMTGMQDFGLLEKLNGADRLPYWKESPCNMIRASEGSFFPPRYYTKADVVHVYDKDLCRVMPLQYREPVVKHGISADLYTPAASMFETVDQEPDNKCYCPGNDFCPPKGLQSISPCQFDAPVYLSYPHFMEADPALIEHFEGLQPVKEKHSSYLKIQPRLGVPIEAKVRLQLNLKVDQARHVTPVAKFPSIIYPIMWIEEGIDDLPPPIRRWIYLATTFADVACPLMTYGFIFLGGCILVGVFINGYKSLVFTKETIEISMKSLRRRSSGYIAVARPKLIKRDTYTLLDLDGVEEIDI